MTGYLRRVGMTQQVLENVPELRLSRKALSLCFNQGELHHPQNIHTYTHTKKRNIVLIGWWGFSIINILRKAETPPSGRR